MATASELMQQMIQRENNLTYEISSIISQDPTVTYIIVEELVKRLSSQALDEVEDIIVNQFGSDTWISVTSSLAFGLLGIIIST